MPQLLGRERDLADIAAFATGPAGYRWLIGGAYAGKTALLYEAVTVGLPDEVDVVCYFLSRRASDADTAGSSPRSCPSWPIYAGWTLRSRTGTSSMPCGGGRPNGPPGRAGRCCS